MALALGGDADVAVAALDDVLTDGESETGALNIVVEFDETLEHCRLLVLGNTRSRVGH